MVVIVMEKVPGVTLDMESFWGYDFKKREKIRGAFRRAWTYASPWS